MNIARSPSNEIPKMVGRPTTSVAPPPKTWLFPKTTLSMRMAKARVSRAR